MNELMQQIMSKKPQTSQRLTITLKTIAKPKFMACNHPTIAMDENELFYTFNGRALFFSREQKEPILSIPEETRSVVFLPREDSLHCLVLNSKNKLESMEYSDIVSGPRYTVTRNVLQVQKTENRAFFIFKKDSSFFIDECTFDGKKWIGKIMCHNIIGNEVILFATHCTFYYTVDSNVYNCESQSLGFKADFIHQYKNLLITGMMTDQNRYEFKILDIHDNYNEVSNIIIPCCGVSKVSGHSDTIVLQFLKDLYILKIDTESKSFSIACKTSYSQAIHNFDFYFNKEKDNLIFYILSDFKYSDMTQIITGCNFSSDIVEEPFLNTNQSSSDTESTTDISNEDGNSSFQSNNSLKDVTSRDLITKEDGFFYENSNSKKSSILKEMESMYLTPQVTERSATIAPKNNLLEEVRATLNRKKGVSKAEGKLESLAVVDRFENFQSLNNDILLHEAEFEDKNARKPKEVAKSIPVMKTLIEESSNSPNKSNEKAPTHSIPQLPVSPLLRNPFESKSNKKSAESENRTSPVSFNSENESFDNYFNEFKKFTLETHKKTILAVESIVSKRDAIEPMIKEIILKSLVPCVEACFNEMRIQILTEIKKITASALDSSEQKSNSINKLLAAGKTTAAIQEFLKLEDHDMPVYISSFSGSALENADSNSLFLLFSKIYELVKKSPKDSYFKLIYFCLMEIEINDLSIDQLQDLSVILRYIKEMNGFDEDKHADLCCILDITSKKIRKRAKQCNGK